MSRTLRDFLLVRQSESPADEAVKSVFPELGKDHLHAHRTNLRAEWFTGFQGISELFRKLIQTADELDLWK